MYIGIGLNNLGQIYAIYGDYKKAKTFFEEGMQIDRDLGNKNGLSHSLANLGILAYIHKDFRTSEKYLQEGLTISREIGNRLGELYALVSFAHLFLSEGNIKTAENYFKECLMLQKENSDIKISSICFAGIAEIKLMKGDFETAARLTGAIQERMETTGAFIEDETKTKLEEIMKSVTDNIGEERYLTEFAKGKKLSTEEAIEIAFE